MKKVLFSLGVMGLFANADAMQLDQQTHDSPFQQRDPLSVRHIGRVQANTGSGGLLFGMISDTHFEEKEDLREYGANALSHIRSFAAAGRACGARFLFHAGDLSNGNRPLAQTCREITLGAGAMRSSGLPALFAIGNHDDNTYFCKAAPSSATMHIL